MADELIDIYNENNEFKEQKMKHEAHRIGLWHRVVHVWIYNDKGEILFQLRAKKKDLYPDRWDCSAAGHIGAGESEIIGALREVEEELGIKYEQADLEFYKTKKVKIQFEQMNNNEFWYIYFAKYNGKIEDLVLQKEEVSNVRFLTPKAVRKMMKETPEKCIPSPDYWNEIMSEIGNRLKS